MSYNPVKTKEEFEQEIISRFPLDSIEILEYSKASGPVVYRCKLCGREYHKSRANHLYENKTLCSKCHSGKTSQMRNSFLKYNHIEFELLDNPNKPINSRFHIKCLHCQREYDYKIQETITDHFSCKYCGRNGSPVIRSEYEKRLYALTSEFRIINYVNCTHSMTLEHICGYQFSVLPFNFLKTCRCPKCHSYKSAGERRISQWLVNQNIRFEEQKHFPELGLKSYDFFLPDDNLLIEYQGEQHIRPIEHFGGEEKFKKQQLNDQAKRDYAVNHNYRLLEIYYYDYNNIENILEGSTTKVD